MRVLITAGPTREPIDAVRYIGNRSSGKMGAGLTQAAIKAGHEVTVILGPVSVHIAGKFRRTDIETAREMHDAVMHEFPRHDLLIMAAAVADFRPTTVRADKTPREGRFIIECEPTEDILAAVGRLKRSDQRTVGFSLEMRGNIGRAREKLLRKNLDLIVYNALETMENQSIEATLLWPDGHEEAFSATSKIGFAETLLGHSSNLFNRAGDSSASV